VLNTCVFGNAGFELLRPAGVFFNSNHSNLQKQMHEGEQKQEQQFKIQKELTDTNNR
jgi:hypothetical protein